MVPLVPAAAQPEPASGGRAAERVSNACFAALMLMNSFSQMTDVSDRLSLLAGLTARIHQLAQVLLKPSILHDMKSRLPALQQGAQGVICRWHYPHLCHQHVALQALHKVQPDGGDPQHQPAPSRKAHRPPSPGTRTTMWRLAVWQTVI